MLDFQSILVISLIYYSSCFIGNSSCGILETPSLNIGTVNIGDRQDGREQNENIFNSTHKSEDIVRTIKKSILYNKKNKHKIIKNIHGDGNSASRILKVLNKINNFKNLLNKKTTY